MPVAGNSSGRSGERPGGGGAAPGVTSRLRAKLIVTALLVAATGGIFALSGAGTLSVIPSVLADPLSIFSMRSPGARASGALTQSKPRAQPVPAPVGAPAFGPVPPKTAGGTGSSRIIYPEVIPSFEPVYPVPVESPVTEDVGFMPDGAGSFGAGGAGPGLFVEGIGGGSMGGGGGMPAVPGSAPPPEATLPVSAVPEPGTWLMMIAGFFLLGAALRIRRRDDEIVSAVMPGKACSEPCV